MKETMGAKGYFRYVDDMVLFDGNKRRLHRIREETEIYLREELGLELHPGWQVFRFHWIRKDGTETGRFLDFMGYRFYRNRTTLRRSMMRRIIRKARKIAGEKPKTVYSAKQMLSYKGWLNVTDTYGIYRRKIKPCVSFRQLRRITAAAQR